MVRDKILLRITITCFIVLIVSVASVAIYDYVQAKETCSDFKSENDCFYEICMAAEYSSNSRVEEAEKCMLKRIYKELNDANLGDGETNE